MPLHLSKAFGGKEVLGHGLHVGSGDGVDGIEHALHVFQLALVQEQFGHVEGVAFMTIAGHRHLSLHLLLGGTQLGRGERGGHQSVELAAHQSAAARHIVGVATKIYAPHASI